MSKAGDNIYHRKDGRWEGRYIKEHTDKGIQYGYIFGHSRQDVKIKLDYVRNSCTEINEKAIVLPAYFCSFGAISNEWLKSREPQIKCSSLNKYKNILNSYLIPSIGNVQIVNIDRAQISDLITKLLSSGGQKGAGLSAQTVATVYTVVKAVFKYAACEKNIATADISGISVKQPKKQMRILSESEQAVLCGYIRDHLTPCNLGILICLYTGLRIGEICALRWSDISSDEALLFVRTTMQRVQQLDSQSEKRTKIQISLPKSDSSIRTIPIPDCLRPFLKREQKNGEAYLLTGSATEYMEPRTLHNRFKTVLRECNIENANFHSLRHTFATTCVDYGIDAKALSEILGHVHVNITLNRYVHPSMEYKQRGVNKLPDYLTIKSNVSRQNKSPEPLRTQNLSGFSAAFRRMCYSTSNLRQTPSKA